MKVIILAGGSGSRLWPLSRTYHPKQFLKLDQLGGESLFQKTFKRALKIAGKNDILVVANQQLKFSVMGQIDEIEKDYPENNIIVEPEAKDTMPAILLGLQYTTDDALIIPSDQLLGNEEEFLKAVSKAKDIVKDYIVTFGIKPSHPHSGYGYIKHDSEGNVEHFKEKPEVTVAEEYVKQGYLWNSGMFFVNREIIKEELDRIDHKDYELFKYFKLEEVYSDLPKISIDKGLIEQCQKIVTIPIEVDWTDLGSFDSMYTEFEKDIDGNLAPASSILIDSKNNFVHADKNKIVALVDVEDHIVIDSDDALLICPREKSEKVKKVVEQLKENTDERVEFHSTVYRPWGYYKNLEINEKHQVKRLHIYPGKVLSLQLHHHRAEHWVVTRGVATVTVGEEEFDLNVGESVHIPVETKHRLKNNTNEELEIIETQTGDYLGEDDIVRFDDEYGRGQYSENKI